MVSGWLGGGGGGSVILIKCVLLPCNLPKHIAQKQVNYHEKLPGIKRFAKTCKKGIITPITIGGL